MSELVKSAQKNEISRAENAPIPIAQMMQLMIEKGITADNVMAMEQLVKLQERIMDRDAEKQFAVAMAMINRLGRIKDGMVKKIAKSP